VARPPAPIEGTISALSACTGPGGASQGVLHERLRCFSTSDWDDPRLDGRFSFDVKMDRYLDRSSLTLWTYHASITNPDGGWEMEPIRWVDFPGASVVAPDVWFLHGDGAYDGLVAVVRSEGPRMLGSVGFSVGSVEGRDPESDAPLDEPSMIGYRGYIIDARDTWDGFGGEGLAEKSVEPLPS
jgi:hypothetical protein